MSTGLPAGLYAFTAKALLLYAVVDVAKGAHHATLLAAVAVGADVSVAPEKVSEPEALMTGATVAYDVHDVVLSALSPAAVSDGPLHDDEVIEAE